MKNVFYKFDDSLAGSPLENFNINKFLKIDPEIQLVEVEHLFFQDDLGYTHKTFKQSINDINIEFSNIKVHFKDGKVLIINGDYVLSIDVVKPKISQEEAFNIAIGSFKEQNFIWDESETTDYYPTVSREKPLGQLVYLFRNEEVENLEKPILAYKFDIFNTSPIQHEWVYVSAENSDIVLRINRVCNINGTAETRYSGTKTISTEAISNGFRLVESGTSRCEIETRVDGNFLIDNDNNWTATEYDNADIEQAALDIHWGAEMFFDYFKQNFNRNSLDDNGHILSAYYSTTPLDNAFWSGGQISIFKGNNRFETTASLDVVAHEFGHGLCENTCDLIYQNESGALNEALSDIWGACVEFFADQSKQRWLIGEEIDLVRPSLRSMENPNAENNPDTYHGDFWDFINSSVHNNSGVMNHWFFLLTEGGNGINDNGESFNVNGIGITDAARITYRAEVVYFTNSTNYHQARDLTIQATKDLFGICSTELESVINAWHAVGVGNSVSQDNSLFLSINIPSFSTIYEYAYSLIEATNTIETNTNVSYESSNQILFKPEFQSKAGCNFSASIIPCSSSSEGISYEKAIDKIISNEVNSITSEDIICFPNPFSSQLTVRLNNLNIENSYFQLISVNGQIIIEDKIQLLEFKVTLPNLQDGIYYLKIVNNDNQFYKKILKSK